MDEIMTPPEVLAENLLKLKSSLINRTPPLPSPRCSIISIKPDIIIPGDENAREVKIEWQPSEAFNGGQIDLRFAEKINDKGYAVGSKPNLIASYFETELHELWPPKRNPSESLSALLSMIATINSTASLRKKDTSHIVRTNKHSDPYFQRLIEANLYHYCDSTGNQVEDPIQVNGNTLYSCKFPVNGLDLLLNKFVIQEAADKLVELENESAHT